MARNASGTYTLPSGNPVVSGTLIDATWANNTLSDLGNEMTDSLSRSGEGAMLAPLRITDGVQATPSLAFSNEPSSGLYRAGSNEWWAVAAGVQNLRFTNTGLTTRAAAGAVGTPSLAAFNDTDTGIYFPGANELAIATGGAARMTFDSAGAVAVPGTFTLSGGTANGVLYLNGSKVATSGSALVFDGTNLGIGTASTTPIIGTRTVQIQSSGGATCYVTTGTHNAYMSVDTSGGASFATSTGSTTLGLGVANGNAILIDANRNVGIGTASPATKLQVQTTGADVEVRATTLTSGNARYGFDLSGAFYNWIQAERSSGAMQFAIGNAEQMRLNATGLGIGTASPSYKLDVNNGGGSVAGLRVSGNDQANVRMRLENSGGGGRTWELVGGLPGANNANFSIRDVTGSTTPLTIDSSGNLGLGVTPSAWATYKAFQLGAQGSIASTGNVMAIKSNNYFDGVNDRYIASSTASDYYQNAGQHIWRTAPSGTAGNTISFTQAMTLTAAGDLALGATATSGNSERLYVAGTANLVARFKGTSGGLASMDLVNDANKSLGLVVYASTYSGGSSFNVGANGAILGSTTAAPLCVGTYDSQPLLLGTNSAERGRFTAGGDLLVGITGNNDPSSAVVRAGLFSGQRSASASTVFQAWNQATTGDNLFVQFYTEGGGGTLRGSIDYNRAGGLVRYNTTSDYRAKDIYGLLDDSGETIDALKVYRGKMHGATMERPMLIAHEAQEIAPYAVTGEKDAVNEDGTPKFQQMDTSSLVPLLIAEIQSLRSRVAALEAK